MNLTPVPSRANSRPSSSQGRVAAAAATGVRSRPGSAASKSSRVGSRGRNGSKQRLRPNALEAWGDGTGCLTTPKSVRSNNFFRQNSQDDMQFVDGREFGWSVAHQACNRGNLQLVRQLSRKGEALLQKCQAGNSVLHVAARSGQLEVIRFLLSQKQVNINGKNKNGWTPLMWAAIVGHSEVAQLLIQATCDIYARDEKGMTALMWAAKHGHQGVAKQLLNAGEHTGRKDYRGLLASDHAKNHSAMITLLEAITRVNQRMLNAAQRNDEDEVAECLQEGAQVNHVDSEGRSALLWAAVHGSVTMLHLLFKYGASTSVLEQCANELDMAINQHRKVVDVLQAADGANARLLLSASLADWSGVRTALEQCAFVNTRDSNHRTCLSWAASYGNPETIRLLVREKAEVGIMDAAGWQPIHFAISGGHVEATSLLHHCNAVLDVVTFEGDTPLQMAVQADDASMVQMLLASSVQVEHEGRPQTTQVAAHRGCASALHVLLMYRANPEVLDEEGQSLLQIAASKGYIDVLQLLLQPLAPLHKLRKEHLLDSRLKKMLCDKQPAAADAASVAESAGSERDSGSANSRPNSRPSSPLPKSSPLIALQADPNVTDQQGLTPLMLAASAGDLCSVANLVEAGASLTQKNGKGQRALDLASTVPVRAALLTATVRKIAGLPRPMSATLKPIREERRRSSVVEHHRFRLYDLPETLGTPDLLEGHVRALLRRVGVPKPDVLDLPVDPIRHRAKGIAYLDYLDIAAADKAEKMFLQAKDVKGPTGTTASLAREGVYMRPMQR